MTLEQTTTHVAETVDLLIEQFKSQDNWQALLDSYSAQIQEIEDVCFQLLLNRAIDTAVGTQLDILGKIVSRERDGKTDTVYRLYIRAQILVNLSSGAPEELIHILDLLITNTFEYIELYPAALKYVVSDELTDDPVEVGLILGSARPGGVGATLEYTLTDDDYTFTFATADAVEVDVARGFSSDLLCAVGQNVGGDAYIVTSPDGTTWTERANPQDITLRGVAHNGEDLWVAVGNNIGGDAYIVTSPDGITWTERANPQDVDLYGVAYNGEDLWCAVGQNISGDGYIITSPDGITWTERANPQDDIIQDIAHDQSGLWVAVGNDIGGDAYIVTSPDGITWTERAPTVAKAVILYSVAHNGEDLWCAVGQLDGGDAYILTSPDGITWTERANPRNTNLLSVSYGAYLWCAVGSNAGGDAYIVTSPDGITWTEQTNPQNIALRGVTYDGVDSWCAVGQNIGGDAYIVTSPDGITWTERANPQDVDLYGVAVYTIGGEFADAVEA